VLRSNTGGQPKGPRSRRCRIGLLAAFAGVQIRRQHLRRAISLTCASAHEMAAIEGLLRLSMFRCKSSSSVRKLHTATLLGRGSLELVA
jgi:hypothetical protein